VVGSSHAQFLPTITSGDSSCQEAVLNASATQPTRSGRAYRVSILGPAQVEAYSDLHVTLDSQHGVVHVFSADAQTHYLTIPIAHALIEWKDPAELQPQLRVPPFGAGAFEQVGEQMQRMIAGMRHGLGDR
jgi:hypothetical protein